MPISQETPSRETVEPSPALRVAAWFFCVLASTSILRPVRDAMGVAGGIGEQAKLWKWTFAATLCACPFFALAAARLPRRALIARTYHASALSLAVFLGCWHLVAETDRDQLGRAFYVFFSVFNLFVVSVFWSATTDLVPHANAVRRFGPIAVGGTLGALAGASVTSRLAEMVGAHNLLVVSAALLELGLWIAAPLLRDGDARRLALALPRGRAALADLRTVFASPLLRGVALYVLLGTVPAAVLYFERSRLVADAVLSRDERAALFATVDLWTQGATILVQWGITGVVLRRFGHGASLAVLPLVTAVAFAAVGAAAFAGWPIFWIYVAGGALIEGTRHALQKPTREVLFTLAAPHERYAAKNAIDTLVHRGGDALCAEGYPRLGILAMPLHAILLGAVPIALVWAFLARGIGKHAKRAAGSA